DMVGLCDIDSQTLELAQKRYADRAPKATLEKDFRKFLDRTDVDAVVFATPDHWHAFQTIEGCKAGKDIYCEKPVSSTIKEGRMMVQAARKYKRVVQVGIHRRSSPLYRELAKGNMEDMIGQIACARTGYTSNMYPSGMGKAKPVAPPATLDWDLWVGPKPEQPFQENIAPYKFRWWISYCSQIANQGVHAIDALRWLLREKAPVAVCAMGGKYIVDDDRTIPDTMESIFEFADGRIVTFTDLESSGNPIFATDENYRQFGTLELRGTNGTFYSYDNRYVIKPERGGQFQDHKPRMKEVSYTIDGKAEGNTDLTARHAQNFLDCIRTREKPNCDIEDGHRSTSMALMANISLTVKKRLSWDPEKEEFIDCPQANAMLFYEYRAPWKLEL
ncbi:MAG: Gfo/Idh/MocA family oxidoreductase, partial [Thermoguttaceae bacterium]|nr:Gfo/Idh/MocA family oxidoreductase [Thermoguttaceae bacterium]